jgi:predicted nucleic-acid-binding protein
VVSVDTNVLIRFVTADQKGQFDRAEVLFGTDEIFIAKTVVLETEWVLRSSYRYSAAQIEAVLRAVVGLPRVEVEDFDGVMRALEWFAAGLDFADALHLASGPAEARFATFDRDLLRRAPTLADAPEVIEP